MVHWEIALLNVPYSQPLLFGDGNAAGKICNAILSGGISS